MSYKANKQRREFYLGLAFLTPNICGVLLFTIFPVLFSLVMAFTNWDLTQHNMFRPEASIEFNGLNNVTELMTENRIGDTNPDGTEVGLWEAVTSSRFLRFLGNTLFFMMGIPFAVGGSLIAAILLSQDTRGGGGRNYLWLLAGSVLLCSTVMLMLLGLGATAMTLLITGAGCGILLLGVTGGLTFYRSLFYTPHFVAGVATYVLWKNLYSAQTGPINLTLQPVLDELGDTVNALPPGLVSAGLFAGYALILAVLHRYIGKLRTMYQDGDVGWAALAVSLGLLSLPVLVALQWDMTAGTAWVLGAGTGISLLIHGVAYARGADRFASVPAEGFGTALVASVFVMVMLFVIVGLSGVVYGLPARAENGLTAPSWLRDYHWAKPSLMVMGFWAAIGSNNMLLYLAALTNVPGELYEAADIDGATPFSRFWNVTWPQLAPTTFFILVMSTINGLQGGFEAARVMTSGGPAGATTTLSYFIYLEGFITGRLGFASTIAWVLFLLVFGVTLFNWKFGNRYVND
ncbi:MAG: sugar ABC transporter permease [Planctomycetota bacterium]